MSKATPPAWVGIVSVACLGGFGLFAALMSGPGSGPVAAIFPPWWTEARALEAAARAGPVLRIGMANIVLVLPDAANGRSRLWRAGAWLLLTPRGFAGCAAR
jgi:hypothetical protein